MIRVCDLFEVIYGVNLELQSIKLDDKGIPFVSRTSKNNGVVAMVETIDNIKPNPANTISVACGGSVMSSFYQEKCYYSGRDLFYLTPKQSLTKQQMLFYATCLSANKWKYNYGRQTNRTLREIVIPSLRDIPDYVESAFTEIQKPRTNAILNEIFSLETDKWKSFYLIDLFDIKRGNATKSCNGEIPLITAIIGNNGVSDCIDSKDAELYANVITVPVMGVGACYAYYQHNKCCVSQNVNILKPKTTISEYVGMFLSTILKIYRYQFSYGRILNHARLLEMSVKLPATVNGEPDWQFMEDYIKSLPYSSALLNKQHSN